MFYLSMPIIVTSLGAEMVYILHQRLDAQGVVRDRASGVLDDLVRCLFDSSFQDTIFERQSTYSMESTKSLFKRIAHSSVLRLNSERYDGLSRPVG